MKKIKFYLFAMMAVLSCGMFTSCDEEFFTRHDDVLEARDLAGEWYGDFKMSYTDSRGYTYDCFDTNLRFYQDSPNSRTGWGQQVDFYYDEDPYRYGHHDHRYLYMKQYYRFEWMIQNGVIRLRYPYDHHLDVDIYDYHMDRYIFDGRFEASRSYFQLDRLTNFVWSDYDRYDNYYMWTYDSYWSKKNNISSLAKKNNITGLDGEDKPSVIVGDSIQNEGKTWRRFK